MLFSHRVPSPARAIQAFEKSKIFVEKPVAARLLRRANPRGNRVSRENVRVYFSAFFRRHPSSVKIGKRGKAASPRLIGKKLILGRELVEKINIAVARNLLFAIGSFGDPDGRRSGQEGLS